jgi:hypothetical protein
LDSKAFRGWTEIDNPWTNDETDNGVLLSLSNSSNVNYFCLSF